MGTAYSAIASGPPEDPRSMAFVEWVVGDYMAHRLRWLINAPLRTRAIYVDPSTGSDSNDGSAGNPVQTLSKVHDILGAESGSCEVIFAAGAVFRERGKEDEWLATDGGHFAAIHCDRDNVTFRNADDDDPPEFWCGNNRIPALASWTLEGTYAGVYELDVSSQTDVADGFGWIVEEASPTTRYTRAASLAAMDGVNNCFFFDGTTDTLYVRLTGSSPSSKAWFLIPNNGLSCLRIEGDGVFVNLPGALWIGWGLDQSDTNSHDYAISVGNTGTDEALVRPGTGLYGSAHIFATWNPGGLSASGGIVTFYGARGGLNQSNGGGERLINFFQPDGGQEVVAVDCLANQVGLTGGFVQSVNGHTSGGAEVDWFLAWGCGESNMNDLPTAATEADYRGFLFFTVPTVDMFGGGELLYISPTLSIDLGTAGTGASTQNYTATTINGVFTIDGEDVTISRGGWFNSANPLLSTGRIDHGLITIIPRPADAGIGTGIDFDVMTTNGVVTNITLRACVIQLAAGKTGKVGVGVGDDAARQIDCGYFEVDTDLTGVQIRDEAGYASATNPLEMTERLVMGTAAPSELAEHATRQAEYDYYLRPRAASDAPGPMASGALVSESPDSGLPTLLSVGDGIVDARLNAMLATTTTNTGSGAVASGGALSGPMRVYLQSLAIAQRQRRRKENEE